MVGAAGALVGIFLSAAAHAAACNPNAQQIADWGQRAKSAVVYDSPKGLRSTGMDEAEIRAAAASNACLKDALDVAKQKPWLKDAALQESFRYLYCERVSSTTFVPHVNHKGTATAFVRVNLAYEEGAKEYSEGGKMEQGACRELFLKQIRENTLALVEKMKARKPAVMNAPQAVKAGLAAAAGPKAPAPESAKAILQGLQKKKANSYAPGASDAGAEPGRGARGAE